MTKREKPETQSMNVSGPSRRKAPSQPSQIFPTLWIGNMHHANNKDVLKQLGITHILNCSRTLENAHPDTFVYMKLPLDDRSGQPLFPHLTHASHFMHNVLSTHVGPKPNSLLVHCHAGVSRSVSAVIYYLMQWYHFSYDEALEIVRQSRPIANPNPGFEHQLRYAEALMLSAAR